MDRVVRAHPDPPPSACPPLTDLQRPRLRASVFDWARQELQNVSADVSELEAAVNTSIAAHPALIRPPFISGRVEMIL